MSPSPLEYLKHIYDELCYLLETSEQMSAEQFSQSATHQRAFARSFEIIGEATKHLDTAFRDKYSKIPWSYMAKMRDKLIHHYFGVDYEMVWLMVVEEIPDLKKSIHAILKNEDSQSGSEDQQ